MKCTDIDELCMYTDISFQFQLFKFDLPCWLACRKLLAASDRNAYSSSSSLVQSASAIPRLLATLSRRLIGRAAGRSNIIRAGGGSSGLPAGGGGSRPIAIVLRGGSAAGRGGGGLRCRCLVAGVLVRRCSGIILVLESALDDLGLGATAGAVNSHDVDVIGRQGGLQLRQESWRSKRPTSRASAEELVH